MTRGPLIVGVGMTAFGKQPAATLSSLACEASRAALADAGIGSDALDAVFAANCGAGLITGQESVRGQISLKAAGIAGMPIFNVENACASGSSAVLLAANHVRAGAAQCVLAIGYEKMAVADRAAPYRAIEACSDIEELAAIKAAQGPEGAGRSVFMDFYADKVRAYFAASGAGVRHLAAIAAKNHGNGARNPYAQSRTAYTVQGVLEAREVVGPLTVPMCAPISDGAAAVVIADAEWARANGLNGVEIAASVLRTDALSANSASQIAATAARAYAAAGIGPADIHVAEVHDATAAGELFGYEDLGLAAPREGWRLLEEGAVALGGRVPVNPSGGLLARGHPLGATGVAQVCELVWQLRGGAGERQVHGARVGVAQCSGGATVFGRSGTAAAMCVTVLRT